MRNDTRLVFNQYMGRQAELNSVPSAGQSFTVNPSVQQTLETKVQESSDFLRSINPNGFICSRCPGFLAHGMRQSCALRRYCAFKQQALALKVAPEILLFIERPNWPRMAPMRMTLHTDYALRMLIYVATRRDGTCTVNDVAEAYGLSRNHLLKVAQTLRDLELVETTRGRAGGIPEIIQPGLNGELITPGDTAALVRELSKVLGSAELRQRYGQAGRQWVIERFSVDAMVEGNLAVYRRVQTRGL